MDDIAELNRTLDDQAAIIRRQAKGMRVVYAGLSAQVPDIDQALRDLDEFYPGAGRSCFRATFGQSGGHDRDDGSG